MEEEAKENFLKAQEIARHVWEFSKPLVKENVRSLDLVEKIEKKIFELDGKPSWPVNISIDKIAAHHTPDARDETVFKEGDLVKVDFGVHINGWISDNAYTVCVGKKTQPMIETSEKALETALKTVKRGVKVSEISAVIDDIITASGFRTIANLSGHCIDQYTIHAHPSIPNTKNQSQEILSDKIIAIEVFVTNGNGWVKESRPISIYQFRADKSVRMYEAKKILDMSQNEFDKLPFSTRWIKGI
jgi:methionyl aminopeptidase